MAENQNKTNHVIYKITKGFCLIINIINFDDEEDMRRNVSEYNVKLIRKAFQYHRFKVDIKY